MSHYRVTNPAKGRYPDACFDGFLVRGAAKLLTCKPIPIQGVSDHFPVVLTVLASRLHFFKLDCYSDRCLVFRLLCKPLTKIILTSQVALKQKRRKNMLRALEFPECPDFPE